MTTIAQIEKAVQGLSQSELAEFRAWFDAYDQTHDAAQHARHAEQVQESIAQYDRGEGRDGFHVIEELKQTLREQPGV